MSYNFVAKALDDGIVFTYNNCTKAIKVFREGNEIKEEEYCEEDENSKLQLLLQVLKPFRLLILIALEFIVVKLIKYPLVIMWCVYIIVIGSYLIYTVRRLLNGYKSYSYELKQYHAAEHMIYNVSRYDITHITVERLRKESMYANDCGSNLIIVDALNFILIGIAANMFGHSILTYQEFIPMILSMLMFIWGVCVIQIWTRYLLDEGAFNYIIQPKFLEEPTDEQLELAIYGMKRVRELEKNLTRNTKNSEE